MDTSQQTIHPTAIIGPDVTIGNNVAIGPYSYITGKVTIGDNTRIWSHVSIGSAAQNIGTTQSLGTISIGSNCDIREFASIHTSKNPGGTTIIGDNCYIMTYCHVAHDVVLENNVTLISGVNLASHVHVEQGAMLMAQSAVHQFCRIGSFTALAPFSGCRQDLPPFCLFNGRPGGFAGLNLIALKRDGASAETISALKRVTKIFYQDKKLFNDILCLCICFRIPCSALHCFHRPDRGPRRHPRHRGPR